MLFDWDALGRRTGVCFPPGTVDDLSVQSSAGGGTDATDEQPGTIPEGKPSASFRALPQSPAGACTDAGEMAAEDRRHASVLHFCGRHPTRGWPFSLINKLIETP